MAWFTKIVNKGYCVETDVFDNLDDAVKEAVTEQLSYLKAIGYSDPVKFPPGNQCYLNMSIYIDNKDYHSA